MASTSSSVRSSLTLPWKLDVFLSFRGEDTRKNFIDHLYAALKQRGIFTFRDDVRLERGEEISPLLFKAIEDSRFAIVIFSRRYADSTWCLEELAKIMDCQEERGQTILPVFYDVTPSEVRKQTGGFGMAFDKHEEAFKDNKEKVEKWRLALKKVGNLSGWDIVGKYESQIVVNIVDFISSRQESTLSTIFEDLVGMDSRLEELKDYLTMARDDVNFIGIHGMGGIGKTTMARVLFAMFKSQYEGSGFLANIREVTKKKGLIHLQKQLLSEILKEKDLEVWDDVQTAARIKRGLNGRKIFLVFDDVDKLEQLQKLAGKHDWFGRGSIIIITTRHKNLLTNHGVDYIYEIEGLEDNDAYKLLFLKAFRKTLPTDEHFALVKDVIRYVKGLPLAIEVLGKHLCDSGIEKWKGLLDRLQEIPDDEIIDRLRISYDGLQDVDKELFLDIACFYIGEPINQVENILDKFGYGITILTEKSLIKISKGKLWMHDLLQEMGWKIVREEHPNEPGKRSRLWTFEDFYHLVTEDTATEMVEGIMVDVPQEKTLSLNGKIFSRMDNLRLLKISNVCSLKGLTFLSSKLRVLEWHGYPLKFLPSSFEANNLIELNMSNGKIEYLWKGIKWCEKLKTIQLRNSCNLTKTSDFGGIPNLESLNLEGCTRLRKVHESVGMLAKLIKLNLKNCKSLVNLPSIVSGMKSLKILNLHGCSKLKKLPSDVGEVECLEELDVGETTIKEWPSSIVGLRKLNSLSLSGIKGSNGGMLMPKRKMELPSFMSFQALKTLNLNGLNLEILPDSLGSLFLLEYLDLSINNFVSLPTSMRQLSRLEVAMLSECKRLQSLAGLPSTVHDLHAISVDGCTSLGAFCCASFSDGHKDGPKHSNYSLDFRNCMKLLENQCKTYDEIAMWIKQWIQYHTNLKNVQSLSIFEGTKAGTGDDISNQSFHFDSRKFELMVPGSDIPYWINIWEDGDTFIMKLPPYWCNHKLMGFLCCAIIQPNEICDPQKRHCSIIFKVRNEAYVRNLWLHKIICDHLVLLYHAFDDWIFDKRPCQEEYAPVTCETTRSITVKKLGIRLVYLEDLENMKVPNDIGRVYEPAQDGTRHGKMESGPSDQIRPNSHQIQERRMHLSFKVVNDSEQYFSLRPWPLLSVL